MPPKNAIRRPEVIDTMEDDEFGHENNRVVHVPIERRMPIGGIDISPDSDAGGIEIEVLHQMSQYLKEENRESDGGPITDSLVFEYGRYRVQLNLGDAVREQ